MENLKIWKDEYNLKELTHLLFDAKTLYHLKLQNSIKEFRKANSEFWIHLDMSNFDLEQLKDLLEYVKIRIKNLKEDYIKKWVVNFYQYLECDKEPKDYKHLFLYIEDYNKFVEKNSSKNSFAACNDILMELHETIRPYWMHLLIIMDLEELNKNEKNKTNLFNRVWKKIKL